MLKNKFLYSLIIGSILTSVFASIYEITPKSSGFIILILTTTTYLILSFIDRFFKKPREFKLNKEDKFTNKKDWEKD